MNEDFIQYVWLHGLFDMNHLKTPEGQKIELIDRGQFNSDSGPDFSHAKIKIDDTLWIGQVEIHLNANEWFKHKHNFDIAYDNTILHVVLNNNEKCYRTDGSEIPCLELKNLIPENILNSFEKLNFSKSAIACSKQIMSVDQLFIQQTIDSALVNRLENKSQWVFEWLQNTTGDWHSVFMASIIRSFGFGINSEAFELLAMSLPVPMICRNAHDPIQIEALLFGCGGFLEGNSLDDYHQKLKNEWYFLKHKYRLFPLDKSVFKHMRMRPSNFPEIRLAQLSAILMNYQNIIKTVLSTASIQLLHESLEFPMNDYWITHYQFAKEGKRKNSNMTASAKQIIIINSVVPFLFVYGRNTGNEHFCKRAMEMLQNIPSEKNHIINEWEKIGIHAQSAYESQALLEQKKNICDKRLCLRCPIGNSIIQKT